MAALFLLFARDAQPAQEGRPLQYRRSSHRWKPGGYRDPDV